MSSDVEARWSPADNPYAIAVSQAWWELQGLLLFAADAKNAVGPAQQIYARQIPGQLRRLQRCAVMQAKQLAVLDVDQAHRDRLQVEIDVFEAAVPGTKDVRDMLEHFDEYARGVGNLQREAIKEHDIDVSEAASMFWGGGYDQFSEELREGPVTLSVPQAIRAAERLYMAIVQAGRAVDAARGSA